MKCFECGSHATENHHIIPKSLGGKRVIPLCGLCHSRVHQMDGTRRDKHSLLTKLGLKRAKEQGTVLGTPKNLTNAARAKAWKANSRKAATNKANIQAKEVISTLPNSLSLRQVADVLNKLGMKTSKGKEFKATTIKRLRD